MASVKQMKSKGRAALSLGYGNVTEYDLRKLQFKHSAPAKIVKPVRLLREVAVEALAAWDRSIKQAVSGAFNTPRVPYPSDELMRLGWARRLSGTNSVMVQHLAAAA